MTIASFLKGVEETLETCEAAKRHFDERSAALDRRQADMDAKATRITEEANAAAYGIVGQAHKSAATIVADARGIADAEAQRHAGEVRGRQDEITKLDAEIAALRQARDDTSREIAELRARLGG